MKTTFQEWSISTYFCVREPCECLFPRFNYLAEKQPNEWYWPEQCPIMVPKNPYMIHDCPDILWYCPYMLLCSYLPMLLPSLFQCHTIIFQLSIVRMKLWLHFLVIVIVANYIVDDLLYMYFQLYLSEVSKFELHLCYVDIVKQ